MRYKFYAIDGVWHWQGYPRGWTVCDIETTAPEQIHLTFDQEDFPYCERCLDKLVNWGLTMAKRYSQCD